MSECMVVTLYSLVYECMCKPTFTAIALSVTNAYCMTSLRMGPGVFWWRDGAGIKVQCKLVYRTDLESQVNPAQ